MRATGTGLARAAPAVLAGAVLLIAALLITGCGTEQRAPEHGRQSELQAPLSAVADSPAAPQTLTVQGVSAPTRAVQTDAAGALLPPQDVAEVGWWVDSALPGSGRGTIVITGHIDEAEQGDGFAKRFTVLQTGDTVQLTTADGRRLDYRIIRRQQADKESGFPADELNRLDGPERLALVTCGGAFVGPPLGYRDNIIAWAEPA